MRETDSRRDKKDEGRRENKQNAGGSMSAQARKARVREAMKRVTKNHADALDRLAKR